MWIWLVALFFFNGDIYRDIFETVHRFGHDNLVKALYRDNTTIS